MNPYTPEKLPLESINWADYVSLIGKANATLARYDGMLQGIVNPAVLLSPLTTQEAVLSSRIEGTQASMEEVLEYEADPIEQIESSKYSDIKEIINYRKAISLAVQDLKERPFCLNMLKNLHSTLLDSVRGRNKAPGEFRRIQNYVGPPGCKIEEATFVPPSVDNMLIALDNWEKYLHFDEKDIIVQLAIAKAQFEMIHPFLDGNGRIGRMIVPLYLYNKGLLSSPMFYLSAYFETHRDIYYARLQAISKEGDWNAWIIFFLEAVLEQAQINITKVHGILELYENMKKAITDITHSQFAIRTLDVLFSRPIFRSSDFAKATGIPTKQTAADILRKLLHHGILKTMKPASGRRAAILAFPALLNLVEGVDIV